MVFIAVGLPGVPPVIAVNGSALVIDTEQNVTDSSGFLKIPCLYLHTKENKNRPVDVKWFDPSNETIKILPHKTFARILYGNSSNSTKDRLFAVKQQGLKSLDLYVHGDSLASYKGNFTCKASSVYFASPVILRRVQVTSRDDQYVFQFEPFILILLDVLFQLYHHCLLR